MFSKGLRKELFLIILGTFFILLFNTYMREKVPNFLIKQENIFSCWQAFSVKHDTQVWGKMFTQVILFQKFIFIILLIIINELHRC